MQAQSQPFCHSDNIDLVDHAGRFDVPTDASTPAAPRVYIAGPMTGQPDHNFPAFRSAYSALIENGYDAVSPLEVNNEQEGAPGDWHACMKKDIAALMTCDSVALLDGWQASRGATLEHFVACTVGIPCQPIAHFLTATSRPLVTLKEASHHE